MARASACCSQNGDVLRGLLHLVSQPLTTLHCALEATIAQRAESKSEEILIALAETDRVIEAVRLMREYLEANEGPSLQTGASLSVAIKGVLEQLSEFAGAYDVKLFTFGISNGRISVRDIWLQRIFLYLIGSLIETVPTGRAITVLLEDGASESVLGVYSLPVYTAADEPALAEPPNPLQQAKIAIARQTLESSGASVDFDVGEKAGFTIRIPKPAANELSA